MKHFTVRSLLSLRAHLWVQYLLATVSVMFVTFMAIQLNVYLPHTSLLLLFMTGVVIVSSQTSLGASVLCSFLSFISFNFFFTVPYYTLDVSHKSDIATLILFLIVTIVTGNLASRMRLAISRYDIALNNLNHFYTFSQKMTAALSKEGVLALLQKNIQAVSDHAALVICKDAAGEYNLIPSHGNLLDTQFIESIWLDKPKQDDWPLIRSVFNGELMAVVVIKGNEDAAFIERCQTLADLAALALQRIKLIGELEQARLSSETEQLRSALLSSVSHDLRTPLASVIGSASTLIDLHSQIAEDKQQLLLHSILNEAERLDRHIQNLLDMTRFGQGKVSLQRDWVDMHDIISSVLSRLDDVLKRCQVSVNFMTDSPIIKIHGLLIEQAILNIVDNAARFSPDNGLITITVSNMTENMIIDISDQGPGIADSDKTKIFDMFYSLNQGDQHHRSGAGLGLAIAQGMIGAHGGTIEALDASQIKGALIRVTLPWIQIQDTNQE